MRFKDRQEAGNLLADQLEQYTGADVVIFALPRGGVPLGAAIAKRLHAPLDLIITRKIGHPFNPEYAIGALSEHGRAFYNNSELVRVSKDWLENEESRLRNEIKRRRRKYMPGSSLDQVKGKTAIIVDDGVATGYTMLAAIDDLKQQQPAKIIVAIPVIPESMAQQLEDDGIDIIALDRTRHYLGSVGAYYYHFPQLEDEKVISLLQDVKQHNESLQ